MYSVQQYFIALFIVLKTYCCYSDLQTVLSWETRCTAYRGRLYRREAWRRLEENSTVKSDWNSECVSASSLAISGLIGS